MSHEPIVTAFSPGRAEWLGNHTDYNDGLVLGIGLEVGATVVVRVTGDRKLVLRAEDLNEERICNLDDLRAVEAGAWANYTIGVAAGLMARGAKAAGVELSIRSDVPMGAGLSRTAAGSASSARSAARPWPWSTTATPIRATTTFTRATSWATSSTVRSAKW